MDMKVTGCGILESFGENNQRVLFRKDEYSGFCFITKIHDKINRVCLHWSEGGFVGELGGVEYGLKYKKIDNGFYVEACIENVSSVRFIPEYVALRTGIDHYMDSFPQWDSKLFPTLLRCEHDGFYGYYSSPSGGILAVASPDPVAAWKICYNKIAEEDEGNCYLNYLDGGHRIYTSDFHLMNVHVDNERYPVMEWLDPGERRIWRFFFSFVDSREDLPRFFAFRGRIPFIRSKIYSIEQGQYISGVIYSINDISQAFICDERKKNTYDLMIDKKDDCVFSFHSDPLIKPGVYTVYVHDNDNRVGTAVYFVQREGVWYLEKARDAVLYNPPCPTHHMECFVSLYTLLYSESLLGWKSKEADNIFNYIVDSLYDYKRHQMKYAATMRIQDTACMAALMAFKYKLSNELRYLEYARYLGDFMLGLQHEDGGYYAQRTALKSVHYTSVTYLGAYMFFLGTVESCTSGFEEAGRKHIESAIKSFQDLLVRGEDIETEGESTFEDGMITCSIHQLSLWALNVDDEVLRYKIITECERLFEKHLCLSQDYVPDSRMNGATLRFWESQYALSIFSDFFDSPCGWSAWRSYGAWNLYILTKNKKYFYAVLNNIRACMQLIDNETGVLRWGFTPDPYIITDAFLPSSDGGEVKNIRIGEQYLEMTSSWHRSIPFPRAKWGIDNLVHECFKAYSEIYLQNAVVVYDEEIICMNCNAVFFDGILEVRSVGNTVQRIYFDLPGGTLVKMQGREFLIGWGWVDNIG